MVAFLTTLDGRLVDLSYAIEAVQNSNSAVGILGTDSVVFAVEKRSNPNFKDTKYAKKIVNLENNIAVVCVGDEADVRALIDKVMLECLRYRVTEKKPVTVEYIARFIAALQYIHLTQSGVRQAHALTTLVGAVDTNSRLPWLYHVSAVGVFELACEVNAGGRNRNFSLIRNFLDENHKETSGRETIKQAIRALLEGVDDQSGGKNIEVGVMTTEEPGLRQLEEAEIVAFVAEIKAEKACLPKET